MANENSPQFHDRPGAKPDEPSEGAENSLASVEPDETEDVTRVSREGGSFEPTPGEAAFEPWMEAEGASGSGASPPEVLGWQPGPWLFPFRPSLEISVSVLKTWTAVITLTSSYVQLRNRWLGSLLFAWQKREVKYGLHSFVGAAIRYSWPSALLFLDGYVYDDVLQAFGVSPRTIRIPRRRLPQFVQWVTEANSRTPRGQYTDEPEPDESANVDLLHREVDALNSRIARQYQMDEALDRHAMTAIAAFVVLIGLAVNNAQHLSKGLPLHIVFGAGLGLSVIGLLTAAVTVLPERMRGSASPFSVRRYYYDHARDDFTEETLRTAELLEKANTANRLELTLKRRRLTREFVVLILGAAMIGATFVH